MGQSFTPRLQSSGVVGDTHGGHGKMVGGLSASRAARPCDPLGMAEGGSPEAEGSWVLRVGGRGADGVPVGTLGVLEPTAPWSDAGEDLGRPLAAQYLRQGEDPAKGGALLS